MEYALRKCDETGTQAFLESSNPRNVALFERHGFEVIGRAEGAELRGCSVAADALLQ